ncbi:MAG: hypothetical protein WCA21_08845 [Terracidiphilus sp.]|jgi:hypothetical protein
MNSPENDIALKALGIRKGVTYSVVPVSCTENACLSFVICQDNAIGLADDEKGGYMICHDYKTPECTASSDKRVFWKRKESGKV